MANEEKYTVEGEVAAKRKDGRAINVAETWYSAYKPDALEGINKGDKVKFQAADKETDTATYHNIRSKVEVTEKGSGGSPNGGGKGPNGGSGGGGRGFRGNGEKGGFPLDKEAYERSLDRRVAVQGAVEVYKNTVDSKQTSRLPAPSDYNSIEEWADAVGEEVVQLARRFEAYTTGDRDREALKNITGEGQES